MKSKIIFFIGSLLLILAAANIVTWIIISDQPQKNFEAVVKEYVSLFPGFLANPIILTLLNIFMLLFAIVCFIYSKTHSNNTLFKKTCLALSIFSGILAGWNLFTLM